MLYRWDEERYMWCNNRSQSYGASPAIWDYSVLAVTHATQVKAPCLNPNRTSRYSIYLPQRDERLSWPWCWLDTEMVYLCADSHPFEQLALIVTRPRVEPTTCWSQVWCQTVTLIKRYDSFNLLPYRPSHCQWRSGCGTGKEGYCSP